VDCTPEQCAHGQYTFLENSLLFLLEKCRNGRVSRGEMALGCAQVLPWTWNVYRWFVFVGFCFFAIESRKPTRWLSLRGVSRWNTEDRWTSRIEKPDEARPAKSHPIGWNPLHMWEREALLLESGAPSYLVRRGASFWHQPNCRCATVCEHIHGKRLRAV